MRSEKPSFILLPAFIVSVLVANGALAQAPRGPAIGADPLLLRSSRVLIPSRTPSSWAVMTAAAQGPPAAEAALDLDRPARRVIQQGLQNEGFDPGAADGLFGPRTRAAIRRWQEARGVPPTGYLDSVAAELLRAAGAPRPQVSEAAPSPTAEASADPSSAALNCEEWNTLAFFENATASVVSACLAAGADPEARNDTNISPLHYAALSGTVAMLDILLEAGADIRARDVVGVTPIHAAASNEDPALVETLLAAGADMEARTDNRGWTPLYWAVRNNANPAVVEALLAAGADVEARDDNGWTPLHRAAARSENPAVIAALLAAGANLEAQLDNGRDTPLSLVVWNNENVAVVEALLTAGANRTWQATDGRTPLHLAAQNNANPAVVQALVAAGADVNAQDNSGNTSLHVAAMNNENPAVVEALLLAAADVTARDNSGRTPLARTFRGAVAAALLAAGADAAELSDLLDYGLDWWRADAAFVEMLLTTASSAVAAREGTDSTVLHVAAGLSNDPAVIQVLVASGADLRAKDYAGRTPLHEAARQNRNPAVIEALVTVGAEVAARDDRGWTPLHYAASDNSLAVFEALVAAGADVGARDDGGMLLRIAAGEGNLAVVEALVAMGADVRARSDRGWTPLHFAAQRPLYGSSSDDIPAVIEALVAAGADVGARDELGWTPLHRAALSSDDPAVIEALVLAGADVAARDQRGRTPLHGTHPVGGGCCAHPAVVEALAAVDADVSARDEDDNTPLHLAARYAFKPEDRPEDWQHAGDAVVALLNAGANANARNTAGRTPWDLAQENEVLRGSDAYWRLNDARFNTPRQESRRSTTTTQPTRRAGAPEQLYSQGPACEIPGYPTPVNVESLGLNWCGPSVGIQRRAIALQAAGAWCALAAGTSSSPDQVNARHQEINYSCDMLDALQARGGPPCLCPAGYRP